MTTLEIPSRERAAAQRLISRLKEIPSGDLTPAAEILQVTEQDLQAMEAGDLALPFGVARRAAQAFGIDLIWLGSSSGKPHDAAKGNNYLAFTSEADNEKSFMEIFAKLLTVVHRLGTDRCLLALTSGMAAALQAIMQGAATEEQEDKLRAALIPWL